MRDLLQFVSTVDGKRDHSHNQWLTIRALELADELYNLAKQNPKSELWSLMMTTLCTIYEIYQVGICNFPQECLCQIDSQENILLPSKPYTIE